jgi:hypothetical protein
MKCKDCIACVTYYDDHDEEVYRCNIDKTDEVDYNIYAGTVSEDTAREVWLNRDCIRNDERRAKLQEQLDDEEEYTPPTLVELETSLAQTRTAYAAESDKIEQMRLGAEIVILQKTISNMNAPLGEPLYGVTAILGEGNKYAEIKLVKI